MSAILNGSNSYLSLAGSGPDYPALFTCWFKPANATHHGTLLAASNNGSGGLQALSLTARGDVTNDPIYAQATSGGSSNQASQVGFAAGSWYLAAALFTSATSRKVAIIRPGFPWAWSSVESTERAITSLDTLSIGALFNSGASNYFNGRVRHAAIWSGLDSNYVDLIVTQLQLGVVPWAIWHSYSDLFFYQALCREANENNSVGGAVTASNVEFDFSDVPHKEISATRHFNIKYLKGPVTPFRWPDTGSSPGPLPDQRVCVLDSAERIQLAAADSDHWMGVTDRGGHAAWDRQFVVHRGSGHRVRIDIHDHENASFSAGDEAFLAAAGRVSSSGSIAIGVVSRLLEPVWIDVDEDTVKDEGEFFPTVAEIVPYT